MATIANLDVEQLSEHLVLGGFLAPFTDIFGNPQPAPLVQKNEVDLTSVDNSARVILIRTTGGVTNSANRTLYKERSMMVVVFGKTGEKDSVIAQGLAEDMEEWLVDNYSDGQCLMNIVSSGVTGPMISGDSRRAYEISLSVSFNIKRVA